MLGVPTLMPRQKKRAVGRPRSPDPKMSLASIKGGKAYAEWFDELVSHINLPASIVMELALREYAKAHGFDKPQPER